MTHIKKLVIKGFKSFARETTIELNPSINVVVGPNGSGKSNVTDALCFVLGRLSIKSMRAAKAAHLIFSGNKNFKGGNEASVAIVFDNSDKTFALDENEISVKRIVKKNGQSTYKINKETRTRNEVIELLSQAGIDPHGFNIILQGEIERFVKMPGEERRKVIEEVAGISVYEMRKEKSLKELERTEEKLKQINGVLRERTKYLSNLENEREEALKFKKYEETIKRCKASILNRKIQDKEKDIQEIEKKIDVKKQGIEKKSKEISKIQNQIIIFNQKADNITNTIQKSSGLEQDTLQSEISNLKQEIAGSIAKRDNFQNQLIELKRRSESLQSTIENSEKDIQEMMKEKGKDTKKELNEKKSKLDELEELKREYFLLKSNFTSFTNQVEDKKRQIQRLENESNFTLNQIEQTESQIRIKESLDQHQHALVHIKDSLQKNKEKISELEEERVESEKTSAIKNQEIQKANEIKEKISKIDICPLCTMKMTEEHLKHVTEKASKDIENFKKIAENSELKIQEIAKTNQELKDKIAKQSIEINTREIDIIKLQTIEDKKQQLQRNSSQIFQTKEELVTLERKKKLNEEKLSKIKISEESYETLKLEVNELARTDERNLGMEISTKQRELERTKLAIKQVFRDKQDTANQLEEIKESLGDKEKVVIKKEEQADILKKRYQKMFEEKNRLQDSARTLETQMMQEQNEKRLLENDINNFTINKAQVNAQKDTLKEDLKEFQGIEFINLPIDKLQYKLLNAEGIIARIGNVNMRALEVYEGIKAEYDKIREKVGQLEKEKEEILNIMGQIDRKKKKAFLHTLKEVNELFSNNFSQLSTKGIVTLDIQNKKEIFDGGLDILVKVGGGKHFDITSLSGGEQTLVALSLIFAIQAFRPYCFYIFDEIDAALDRRNSEKLAYLLKKYMKDGQYLIITHNDSIISESSSVLYGVTMQDGISKVLSLDI